MKVCRLSCLFKDLHPRPAFVRDASFTFEFLHLDDVSGIQVPASINGFLREYQREGVRFLWDSFKEGRGGVLGDDMGLVCILTRAITFYLAVNISINRVKLSK